MLILGIETSVREGSVALRRDGRLLEERRLAESGRRHASTLVAGIDRLLSDHGAVPRDLDAVAVSIGPGSFTGLRVGVVCAKTLAWASGCRIAAVDTFLAVAENSHAEVSRLWVVGDAQRGDLYAAEYRRNSAGDFERLGEISLVAAGEWLRSLRDGQAGMPVLRPEDATISGPGLARIEDSLPPGCRRLEADLRQPSAAVVARLGERQIREGRSEDFWTLEPFYLRRSAAEEKRDPSNQDGAGETARL